MIPEKGCATGRCAYGEPCVCEFYAKWRPVPPCPMRPIRSGGYRNGYRDGWRLGFAAGLAEGREESEVA